MTILITGAAGFAGSSIAGYFRSHYQGIELLCIDNLSRRGSECNLEKLKAINCKFFHGDIRSREDVDDLPRVDWIVDCAANPSVLAGLQSGSLGLVNNNLLGTINLLEKCKKDQAGFIMLSTSRVYSINALNSIPISETGLAFEITSGAAYPDGFSGNGVGEAFSTAAPVSLYGATKLASEVMALEYHYTFGFPVWIDRCGVIAGPGQFGKIDQGIFSYWIYQYLLDKPLSYIGFGGKGKQARDMVHPYDVYQLIDKQIHSPSSHSPKILNIGGGISNTLSLAQLDAFCKANIRKDKAINAVIENRSFDIPLYVSDHSKAQTIWGWKPSKTSEEILQEILSYANENLEFIRKISA